MADLAVTVSDFEELIEFGKRVLNARIETAYGGSKSVNRELWSQWEMQSTSLLRRYFGNDSGYLSRFRDHVQQNTVGHVERGLGVLAAVVEDLRSGRIVPFESGEPNALLQITRICDRFHLIVRQLRNRYDSRPTIDVRDEYDGQDLLHALLLLDFDDVRAEECTASYAGKSSRMDFLLKKPRIVVEHKKTRSGLAGKEVASQLIEDIDRYKIHPDCGILVCFVYDPEGLIANPRGIEGDLSRDGNPFPVRVFIRPK